MSGEEFRFICDLCLQGQGKECHSPGCVFWLEDVPPDYVAERIKAALSSSAAEARREAQVEPTELTQLIGRPEFRGLWKSRTVNSEERLEEGWSVTFVRDGDYLDLPYQETAAGAVRAALQALGELPEPGERTVQLDVPENQDFWRLDDTRGARNDVNPAKTRTSE